ncbi:MAG: hypothetical protein ABL951_00235, partial [Alphaproteobacteria bacterium]
MRKNFSAFSGLVLSGTALTAVLAALPTPAQACFVVGSGPTFIVPLNFDGSLDPGNCPPGAFSTRDAALVFSAANDNLISIADDAATVQVTLTGTNGTVTLSGITGLVFTTGDGTADATMTFSGTKAAVNAALAGMSFIPTVAFT